METVYITGHKVPDLDSVAAAVSYAALKKAIDPSKNYIASVAGTLNAETSHALEMWKVAPPQLITTLKDASVILVDHNEKEQVVDDMGDAKILEVIDHHKLNFSYSEPIRIIIEPVGSTCTILAKMYKGENIPIDPSIAGLMLAAVLTDTVITKSPTTTNDDRMIIEELAAIAGVSDWRAYGMEIFKVRSSVATLLDDAIVTADFKDFDINGKKFGIGQVESVDASEFDSRIDGLQEALGRLKTAGGYDSTILFVTDIMTEESRFLMASERPEVIAAAFNAPLENGIFRAKVLSRKKEVVPALLKAY